MIPIASILDAGGVSIMDTASFLPSKEGLKLVAKEARMVRLEKKEFCWVPAGYFLIPIYLGLRKEDAEWSHVWHYTPFNAKLYSNLDERCVAAIERLSGPYLASEGAKMESFKARVEKFVELVASLKG